MTQGFMYGACEDMEVCDGDTSQLQTRFQPAFDSCGSTSLTAYCEHITEASTMYMMVESDGVMVCVEMSMGDEGNCPMVASSLMTQGFMYGACEDMEVCDGDTSQLQTL